ncbi:MAG: hypothetical protein HY727_19575 [Candidatus Rokubacteria bacterium]|nr:hypothetical protein [Candidatus Rokubacteria bacterium]
MPGYDSSSSETTTVTSDGGRLTVTGRLCFTYRVRGSSAEELTQYLGTMTKRGWKIGLQLRPGQQLERLAFAGKAADVVLARRDEVSQELERAFPCEGAEVRWVGLVAPKGAERRYTSTLANGILTICYTFTLVITDARCLPQALVMALTYEDERFANHYLLHVLLITAIPGARTRVAAIVDGTKREIAKPRAFDAAPAKKKAVPKKKAAKASGRRRKK